MLIYQRIEKYSATIAVATADATPKIKMSLLPSIFMIFVIMKSN